MRLEYIFIANRMNQLRWVEPELYVSRLKKKQK